MAEPAIFVVATPIGNLDDLSPRGLATLRHVDLIAAEDTRNTRKLLSHFGINGKELISYHDHVEAARSEQLVSRLKSQGLTMALVSDAGTPCVADPGYRLIRLAKQSGIKVHPVPGASALTSLISAAGLPSDRVMFVGFLPTKESDLRREIQSWKVTRSSIVFFEPTRRLESSLAVIAEIYPQSEVSIGRELTKLYEEIETMSAVDAIDWVKNHAILKGEAVVMVHLGALDSEGADVESLASHVAEHARRGFAEGKSLKDLLKELGGLGIQRSELYQMLLEVKETFKGSKEET